MSKMGPSFILKCAASQTLDWKTYHQVLSLSSCRVLQARVHSNVFAAFHPTLVWVLLRGWHIITTITGQEDPSRSHKLRRAHIKAFVASAHALIWEPTRMSWGYILISDALLRSLTFRSSHHTPCLIPHPHPQSFHVCWKLYSYVGTKRSSIFYKTPLCLLQVCVKVSTSTTFLFAFLSTLLSLLPLPPFLHHRFFTPLHPGGKKKVPTVYGCAVASVCVCLLERGWKSERTGFLWDRIPLVKRAWLNGRGVGGSFPQYREATPLPFLQRQAHRHTCQDIHDHIKPLHLLLSLSDKMKLQVLNWS